MIKLIYTLFILLVCTTAGCINDNEPQGPSLVVGDSLPVFSVVMNNGEVVSTESLKGLIPVIVFFNTDCSDCRKELPVIQKLWDLYKDNAEVKILAIAREESASQIMSYWEENNLTLPWSAQENRDVYSLFATSVIPRIYIADKTGVITATFGDQDMPTLEQLETLLQSSFVD